MRSNAVRHLGWPIVTSIVTASLVLWLIKEPFGAHFENNYTALTSLGVATGLIAFTLFCCNVILSTRLRFIEDLFGGLNKVYIAHHLTGGTALIIVLLHPIMLSLRLMTTSGHDAAMLLIPRPGDIPTALGIIALWVFIGLMFVTFYMKLPYNIWLFTHKFLGAVLLLIGLHIIFSLGDISDNQPLKIYMYVLFGISTIAYIYRTMLPRFFVRHYTYIIAGVGRPAKGVAEIYLKPKDKNLRYIAGQFVFLRFNSREVSHEWHPFSISSNERDGLITVTIKSLGSYTKALVEVAPNLTGTEVSLEGAYGRFSFHNFKSKHQIWIAGGIGITPFLGMIKDISPEYKIDFYYSVKDKAEMIHFQDIIQSAESSNGNFRFIPILTSVHGYLSAETIQHISGDLADSEILLCGPPAMMHSLRDQLKKAGVNKWLIHSEEFAMS